MSMAVRGGADPTASYQRTSAAAAAAAAPAAGPARETDAKISDAEAAGIMSKIFSDQNVKIFKGSAVLLSAGNVATTVAACLIPGASAALAIPCVLITVGNIAEVAYDFYTHVEDAKVKNDSPQDMKDRVVLLHAGRLLWIGVSLGSGAGAVAEVSKGVFKGAAYGASALLALDAAYHGTGIAVNLYKGPKLKKD